jgi:hypothetical protein
MVRCLHFSLCTVLYSSLPFEHCCSTLYTFLTLFLWSLLNIFFPQNSFSPLSSKTKIVFHKCVLQSHLFRSGRLHSVKKVTIVVPCICNHCLTSNFYRAGLCFLILYTNKIFHCPGFYNCLLHLLPVFLPHNVICILSVFLVKFAVYFTRTRTFYATL